MKFNEIDFNLRNIIIFTSAIVMLLLLYATRDMIIYCISFNFLSFKSTCRNICPYAYTKVFKCAFACNYTAAYDYSACCCNGACYDKRYYIYDYPYTTVY